MGPTTDGQLPYKCVRKVAFLWWVFPFLGQSSLHSFVSFDEPLCLPKVVTLNLSSGDTVLSGARSSTGMLRCAILNGALAHTATTRG